MFLLELLMIFVALYPVVTSMMWVSGGILFRFLEEPDRRTPEPTQWAGVSVLIPAYNEEAVISTSVEAALAADYPNLEVLVLDDGSADETAAVAAETVGDDPRCRVIRDPVNRGKADRLNQGFRLASHELVVVTDADTQMHPAAVKELVARMLTSQQIAAVAGAPHVTNRQRFLSTVQIFEAASIIGLIRRTQAMTGRVGTVAGVLGLFRLERVLAIGGYDPKMATEDIELTMTTESLGHLDVDAARGRLPADRGRRRRHRGSRGAGNPDGAPSADFTSLFTVVRGRRILRSSP